METAKNQDENELFLGFQNRLQETTNTSGIAYPQISENGDTLEKAKLEYFLKSYERYQGRVMNITSPSFCCFFSFCTVLNSRNVKLKLIILDSDYPPPPP